MKPAKKLFANGRPVPSGKSSADFTYYVHGCLSKAAYAERNDAIKAAFLLGYNKKIRVQIYQCEFCGKWHVTHKISDANDPRNRSFDVTGPNGRPWGFSKELSLLNRLFGDMRREQKKELKAAYCKYKGKHPKGKMVKGHLSK